jgi:hypothetical protein
LARIAGAAGSLLDKDVRLIREVLSTADEADGDNATAAAQTLLNAADDALATMRATLQ